MARDKLITIRIEGEKREAFNQLAKSQNTDTASLLYDFINQCLSGTLDISLVTGKGNWIDNQLDSDRIDKLETATQEIDNRLGKLSKKLDDWIEAFGDRLTDCERELSDKITSLEHRLNALARRLDRQKIDSEIGSIDTDSQKDSQQIDDMEYLLKRERECSIATSPLPPNQETVETADNVETANKVESVEPDSIDEPVKEAIESVGMNATDAAKYLKTKKVKVSYDSLNRWIKQEKIPDTSPQGKNALKHLILRDKLYYPKPD